MPRYGKTNLRDQCKCMWTAVENVWKSPTCQQHETRNIACGIEHRRTTLKNCMCNWPYPIAILCVLPLPWNRFEYRRTRYVARLQEQVSHCGMSVRRWSWNPLQIVRFIGIVEIASERTRIDEIVFEWVRRVRWQNRRMSGWSTHVDASNMACAKIDVKSPCFWNLIKYGYLIV